MSINKKTSKNSYRKANRFQKQFIYDFDDPVYVTDTGFRKSVYFKQ